MATQGSRQQIIVIIQYVIDLRRNTGVTKIPALAGVRQDLQGVVFGRGRFGCKGMRSVALLAQI